MRPLPPSVPSSHQPFCHPEARAFCGPKDLCNLPPSRRSQQIAQVLRFAQDDKPCLGELDHYQQKRFRCPFWKASP
jgi:hypothetical protein